MNRSAIAIGLVAILAMGVLPPWDVTEYTSTSVDVEGSGIGITAYSGKSDANATSYTSFRPFWAESEWTVDENAYEAEIDMQQLLVQVVVGALVFGGLAFLLPGRIDTPNWLRSRDARRRRMKR